MSSTVIIGGTRGLGRNFAEYRATRGDRVVIAGRDPAQSAAIAAEIGSQVSAVGLDLAVPESIASALAGVGPVDHLVLAAIDRDHNSVRDYAIDRAIRLAVIKLVAYTEVVHVLLPAMHDDSAIVVFGGGAFARPYPGSTTVTTVNGGVVGMVRTMAVELAPIRVNGLHPGIIGDSPYWADKPAAVSATEARTPIGRTASMADISDAVDFLLRNRGINGENIAVNGGSLLT
jgi:NAD(P)-dependent dehydrogenase (short-subunit alcohol dehydrogenase family)